MIKCSPTLAKLDIVELKFFNFHGQNGARLSRDQSIHGPTDAPRSYLIGLLSPLLFGVPNAHLHTLNNIYVDRLVSLGSWKPFINRLNDGWQGFTLFASRFSHSYHGTTLKSTL
jgi:hypothetical protein